MMWAIRTIKKSIFVSIANNETLAVNRLYAVAARL